MSATTLLTMVLVLATVVGGFIGFLSLALRSERRRSLRAKRDAG